jgi:hypothetical protein
MKSITFLGIIAILTSLNSCKNDEDLQEVRIDNRYTILIPSYLTQVSDLNEDASLQYMDAFREYYVIVIDEDKDEFHAAIAEPMFENLYTKDIDGYANLLITNFESNVEVKTKTKTTATKINGMPARLVNMNASFDGVDVFCSLSYLEGKRRYYQVFSWTLQGNENKYKESLNAIAKTLKEI